MFTLENKPYKCRHTVTILAIRLTFYNYLTTVKLTEKYICYEVFLCVRQMSATFIADAYLIRRNIPSTDAPNPPNNRLYGFVKKVNNFRPTLIKIGICELRLKPKLRRSRGSPRERQRRTTREKDHKREGLTSLRDLMFL
jgi:hypothetical protein